MSDTANANKIYRDIVCKFCGYTGQPQETGKFNEMHGFCLKCPNCGRHWGWGGKSKELKNEAGERVESSIWSAKRLGIEHCQCCLRHKDHLGDDYLEVHHVLAVKDGGTDDLKNLWIVCTACHKEIHHRRKYYFEHMMKYFEAWEQMRG